MWEDWEGRLLLAFFRTLIPPQPPTITDLRVTLLRLHPSFCTPRTLFKMFHMSNPHMTCVPYVQSKLSFLIKQRNHPPTLTDIWVCRGFPRIDHHKCQEPIGSCKYMICKTLKKEGRAFRNIGQKIIYS